MLLALRYITIYCDHGGPRFTTEQKTELAVELEKPRLTRSCMDPHGVGFWQRGTVLPYEDRQGSSKSHSSIQAFVNLSHRVGAYCECMFFVLRSVDIVRVILQMLTFTKSCTVKSLA